MLSRKVQERALLVLALAGAFGLFAQLAAAALALRIVVLFPPLVPQVMLLGVLTTAAFVRCRTAVSRWILAVMVLMLGLGLAGVANHAAGLTSGRTAGLSCGYALSDLREADRQQIELPEDLAAVPNVEFTWTGDFICSWPGGSSPSSDVAAIYDAKLWMLLARTYTIRS